MRERPILFSGPMVRAILAGRKTQTRRVITPQPSAGVRQSVFVLSGIEDGHGRELRCPYGMPGDVLWVKETWGVASCYNGMPPRDIHPGAKVAYAASGGTAGVLLRPSIYMPRWASRISLRIIEVRVQRVQVISARDVGAEGFPLPDADVYITPDWNVHGDCETAFHLVWDAINGKRGYMWDSNPWVWALSFERISDLGGQHDSTGVSDGSVGAGAAAAYGGGAGGVGGDVAGGGGDWAGAGGAA